MSASRLRQVFGGPKVMTNRDLSRMTEGIDSVYNCVVRSEALKEKRGYDNGKQFPIELYRRGIQSQLLDHWLSSPGIHTLDGNSYNFDAGQAGCEWAAFLRVRDPNAVILRVYPKSRATGPEQILCQLLSSLIYNFSFLVPARFEQMPGLRQRNFELLERGGAEGVDAGVRILEALPPFDLRGEKMLCIMDALNLAKTRRTADGVRQLMDVLESIAARNGGHLLYTVSR